MDNYIKIKLSCLLLFSAMLFSCATGSSIGQLNERIKSTGEKFPLYMTEVPSPNSPIAAQMMLATINMGSGSNAISGIEDLMKKSGIRFGVVGDNQDINVASLELALKNYVADSSTDVTIFIEGSKNKQGALEKLAKEKNINLKYFAK